MTARRRAIQVTNGDERVVDADEARRRGLTVVDLSDGWAPSLFDDGTAEDGSILPNRYRAVFVGLANDRTDGDGQPLSEGQHNYLELYGVPPSLSVLRERFLTDASRICDREIDVARLTAVDEIRTWGTVSERKEHARHASRGVKLASAASAAGVSTLDELALLQPRQAREIKEHLRFESERTAYAELEKRLVCEGLLDASRHTPGRHDQLARNALVAFQEKTWVHQDQGDIRRQTLEMLARPLLVNDFAALRRVLAERVAHAAGVIEDGSAAGSPDLIGVGTDRLLARLGISTPEDAVAFFRRHGPEDFKWMKVAVRTPDLPEHYGSHMELSAEIDRGDVWYDLPFDAKGQRLPQPRSRYPAFTLFTSWRGERVPLVRWRTTVGGWRSELSPDGDEYWRYKESDVGPRVWRHVVAAPVWLPPGTSPVGGMVKEKLVNGAFVNVTNYDETGPGYLSAYGLAAAIHVKESRRAGGGVGYFDNGIRTHGSFDYRSLSGRFSHGCHRLQNNLAVRLFSFVLKHRRHRVVGPVALNFRRFFWWRGDMFDLRLPSRGFYYELLPPVPVETLVGAIKGRRKQPVDHYVRKPGVSYRKPAPPPASDSAESKAGGAEGGG